MFYDLEWTGSELLQIGGVSLEDSFARTILTKSDIHPKVTASIFLQTRLGPDRSRQVYDCKRELFLPSTQPLPALKQFMEWIKSIKAVFGQVTLVSHGNVDIPVLYQSFAEHDMETEFLQTCSHFVNFQEYIREHFVGVPLGLPDLVKLCCPDASYRLHCAEDDAKATQEVFFRLHEKKTVWDKNTQLVVIDKEKFGSEFATVKKVRLNFINYEKEGKEMKFLSHKINTQATSQLVDNMGDWSSMLAMLPLFEKVDPPPCHMFSAGGWVTRHFLEEDNDDGQLARTVVELLCRLGKSYFKLQFLPDSKATFMRRKIRLSSPAGSTIPSGTPFTARLQLKAGLDIRVMYIKEGVQEGTLKEALAKIIEFGDLKRMAEIGDLLLNCEMNEA